MGKVYKVWDSKFHGIDIMDNGEEVGFEGCYSDKLDHPDPRPAHQIWLKKVHAEKLARLFFEEFSKRLRKHNYDFAYTFEELMGGNS